MMPARGISLGAFLLAFCFSPAVGLAQEYILLIPDQTVRTGESFALDLEAQWAEPITGFTLVMSFPPNPPIEGLDFSVDNTIVGEINPEFVLVNISIPEGEAIVAVLFEVTPPIEGIALGPLGFPLAIAQVTGSIPEDTPEQQLFFDYVDGAGTPPQDNIFVVGVQSVPPTLTAGGTLTLEIEDKVIPYFIRGDITMNGSVDIADAIFQFNYAFGNGPDPVCDDAGDSNDDGQLNVADPIYTLNFLFADGPIFWPPFPNPGTDWTPDSLECDQPLEL